MHIPAGFLGYFPLLQLIGVVVVRHDKENYALGEEREREKSVAWEEKSVNQHYCKRGKKLVSYHLLYWHAQGTHSTPGKKHRALSQTQIFVICARNFAQICVSDEAAF